MKTKLPPSKNENKLLIICEGYEEFDYLQRLKNCHVWDKKISVDIKNAKSIDQISAVYSYNFMLGIYKLVVVFCDTEQAPYAQFLSLKAQINSFHGKKKVADHVVFYANPCTLQIILSHFENVRLTSNSKSDNAGIIKKLTGVEDYRATKKQRMAIMEKVTNSNYAVMKQNLSFLSSTSFDAVPSTNILLFFDHLDCGDTKWLNNMEKLTSK